MRKYVKSSSSSRTHRCRYIINYRPAVHSLYYIVVVSSASRRRRLRPINPYPVSWFRAVANPTRWNNATAALTNGKPGATVARSARNRIRPDPRDGTCRETRRIFIAVPGDRNVTDDRHGPRRCACAERRAASVRLIAISAARPWLKKCETTNYP